ncbi:hypothetical protein BT96DRAFT_945550 [Gymnopus androsaceus JB14]|uniref:Uncharacterized protein n=1 Tax=Gymnopus androsaceus JB14 TaxID=1447944 RepID=A0A6A4H0L5_9AGAR|nr:hypothetical protein BT96DRAFT_945550 [Gymnopus androsaceus JB14]
MFKCLGRQLQVADSSAPAAAPELLKRKRGEMGPDERRAARAAAQATSEIIMAAVQAYVEKVDRIRQLAGQLGVLKGKRASSDWNILVSLKSQELNEGVPSGSKLLLAEIQDALHDDEDLMNILDNDKAQMKKLREEFKDGKLCLLIEYINKSTGAWGFGVVACASYDSTVQSGFFGRGDIDGFTRQAFNISVQEFTCLLEDYACTATTCQLTKTKDIKMSYARYDQDICTTEGVMIEGWPEDVEFGVPSKLKVALQIRALYELWKTGNTHWRAMTSAEKREVLTRPVSDDEDEEDGEDREADYQPKKTTSARKRRRAADGNDEEGPVKKGKRSSNSASSAMNTDSKKVARKQKSIIADSNEKVGPPLKKSRALKSKAAVAPLTDKARKLAALKKRKVIPGSKAPIATAQFAESRAQLKEMR